MELHAHLCLCMTWHCHQLTISNKNIMQNQSYVYDYSQQIVIRTMECHAVAIYLLEVQVIYNLIRYFWHETCIHTCSWYMHLANLINIDLLHGGGPVVCYQTGLRTNKYVLWRKLWLQLLFCWQQRGNLYKILNHQVSIPPAWKFFLSGIRFGN